MLLKVLQVHLCGCLSLCLLLLLLKLMEVSVILGGEKPVSKAQLHSLLISVDVSHLHRTRITQQLVLHRSVEEVLKHVRVLHSDFTR